MKAREILGLVMMVAGLGVGLYMGVWWAFIGGIVQVIQEIRAENLEALNVAFGIARVIFAAVIGWLSAIVLLFPGWLMLKD